MTVNALTTKPVKRRRESVEQYTEDSSEEHKSSDVIDVTYHLSKRLTRFIRLGAMAQTISIQTKIPRAEIFIGGPSQFQDKPQGKGYHAAHIVRVQISDRFDRKWFSLYQSAVKFLGHTHKIPSYINLGIDKQIDTIQSENVEKLANINFCALSPIRTAVGIINDIKQKFINAIDIKIKLIQRDLQIERQIKQRRTLVKRRDELNNAKEYMTKNMSSEYLFIRARNCGLNPKICTPISHPIGLCD